MKRTTTPPVIVGIRELEAAFRVGLESARPKTRKKAGDNARMIATLSHAMQSLRAEKQHPGVMVTSRDATASLLQTYLARQAHKTGKIAKASGGGLEAKFDNNDILGWAGSFFTWWRRIIPARIIKASTKPLPMPNRARLALFSDWATGLYGAPEIQKAIESDGDFQVVMHLGDTYYSGDDDEIRDRLLKFFPNVGGAQRFALNGNHEMYTGGRSYFGDALPALGQKSSYFALQNDNWLLLGLDSAHTDHDLSSDQANWVHTMVDNAEGRKVILFSHHQPISLLERQGPRLIEKLGDLLDRKKIFAWYWGHEHRCLLHDKHPIWGMYGRCIGHGGFPYFRDDLGNAPAAVGPFRRLDSRDLVPGGLVLDGENPYIPGHEREYGPHGYVAVELDGDKMNEVIHDASGAKLLEQELT